MVVIDDLPPRQNKRINGTAQDLFDAEIMEKRNQRDRLFKKK